MKKLYSIPLMLMVLCIGMVSATWVYQTYFSSDFEYTVEGSDPEAGMTVWPLSFNGSVDTNSENTTTTNYVNFTADGPYPATFHTFIDKTDVNDSCTDWENDCEVVFYINKNFIEDGDMLNLTAGTHELQTSLVCEHYSCPQNITGTVGLEILPEYL